MIFIRDDVPLHGDLLELVSVCHFISFGIMVGEPYLTSVWLEEVVWDMLNYFMPHYPTGNHSDRIYFCPYIHSFQLWGCLNFILLIGGGKSLIGLDVNLGLAFLLFILKWWSQELAENFKGRSCAFACVHLCCFIKHSFLNHYHSQESELFRKPCGSLLPLHYSHTFSLSITK